MSKWRRVEVAMAGSNADVCSARTRNSVGSDWLVRGGSRNK